jgi:hypothetical protein
MYNEHDEYDMDHEPVFHKRIDILKDQGYCGFTKTGSKQKWDGVEVVAENSSGKKMVANGETREEALKKVIDLIDLSLEDK